VTVEKNHRFVGVVHVVLAFWGGRLCTIGNRLGSTDFHRLDQNHGGKLGMHIQAILSWAPSLAALRGSAAPAGASTSGEPEPGICVAGGWRIEDLRWRPSAGKKVSAGVRNHPHGACPSRNRFVIRH
jgi:hypothetical protein